MACGLLAALAAPALAQNSGGGNPAAPAPATKSDGAEPKKIYVIELKGKFGEDISETPLKDALKDAKAKQADVVIISVENDWSMGAGDDRPQDAAAGKFDELFRAEDMAKIITEDVRRDWEHAPEIVFWVKQAMGGAAFLPLASDTIYFSRDARMGGIGNLELQFGTTGDEVVRQKQFSLRIGHAEGLAIQGGYEARLVRAMARIKYVLSVKYEGGRPVYLERMPQGADEFLLTDDGTDERQDTDIELARGEGNDVLTLTAETARNLQVSKGTVNSLDELLDALNLSRSNEMVDKRSKQITEGWSKNLADSKRSLKRLWREANEVQVKSPGGYTERTQARGARRSKLEEMLRIYARYGEGISGQWRGQNQIPSETDIRTIIDQIKLEQLRDKK